MPTPRAEGFAASMPASLRGSPSHRTGHPRGPRSPRPAGMRRWTTTRWRSCSSSTLRTAVHSPDWPRILSENLTAPAEPLPLLLRLGSPAHPRVVARLAARALLGPVEGDLSLPAWLAPHQEPAARRLCAILDRYGGALLADAVGLGKSYVALAVALARREPFSLVVPAVLVPQWRALLAQHNAAAPIITHESLSTGDYRRLPPITAPYRLLVVDEAHRFRNPDTRRYRALAKRVVGARVLLVTATPVHNRLADLFHLFRLFLRDHELAALGVASLQRAAAGEVDPATLAAVAARLTVARSRDRVQAGYGRGPLAQSFPHRLPGERVRAGVAPEPVLLACVAGAERLSAGGPAAPLLRITLLRRLASSLAAFRASVARHAAFLDLALAAARARSGPSRRWRKALGHRPPRSRPTC